jgi:hypothetical protein
MKTRIAALRLLYHCGLEELRNREFLRRMLPPQLHGAFSLGGRVVSYEYTNARASSFDHRVKHHILAPRPRREARRMIRNHWYRRPGSIRVMAARA